MQIDVFPVVAEYNAFTFMVSKYLKILVDHFWKANNIVLTKFFFRLGIHIIYPLFHLFVRNKRERVIFDYGVGFWKEIRYKKDIFPLSEVEFEGHIFNAPKDPLTYCKNLYGDDCMDMPSADKIYGHQSFVKFL